MPSGHVFSRQWLTKHLPNATTRSNVRPDIQGLRMLAVVAVVLDHLLLWPSGGFVGVDVFFVISGFLITGILLREHEKRGHISFVGFYRRRAKRIIPAATVVLVAVVAAGYLVFNQVRAQQTLWDAIASFFFVANWNFAAAGTDYFQADGPVSPLQHFWSLSVEEQFYFVWPWLMLGVLALAARRSTAVRRRTITGIMMAGIVLGTFAWSMFESASNPTIAYFSTLSRSWELGLGALIAIATPWWSRIPLALRPVLGWIGLIGILSSYFLINDTLPFPAPWALLPVLATALVIVGGTGGEQRFLWPLTNPVSYYIGNISYSLYLWHFPVIVFGAILIPEGIYYPAAAVLMLAISILSYHLIELPVQKSPLLEPRVGSTKASRSERKRSAWRQWRSDYRDIYRFGSLGAALLITVPLVAVALMSNDEIPSTGTYVAPTASETPAPGETPAFGPEVTAVQQELAAGLSLSSWPATEPTLDYVIANDMIPNGLGPCGDLIPPPRDECTWGDPAGTKTAVLVGDSVAMAWVPALLPTFASGEWKLVVQGMYGCPYIDIKRADEQAKMDACVTRKADAIAAITEIRPDLVIVSNTYLMPELESGGNATPAVWGKGLGTLLMQTAPLAAKTVVLTPPPAEKDIRSCYAPTSSPGECISKAGETWHNVGSAERTAAQSAGAVWVDTSKLFCIDSSCPPTTPTLPIKRDITHVTQPYAERIALALRELLTEAGAI